MIAAHALPEKPGFSDFSESSDFSWAVNYLGAPWVLGGRDPATGWDCLGLVEYLQPRHFGLAPTASQDLYPDDAGGSAWEAQRIFARLFPGVIQHWREVSRRPGAAVLFRSSGRPVHCGLYLTDGLFLHVAPGAATALGRLSDPDYRQMRPEFYVPA